MPVNIPGVSVFAGAPPLPIETTGRVFYVGSTACPGGLVGVDAAGVYGDSPQKPFATVDYAFGQCVANRGDVIVCLPGHSETLAAAAAIDADVAGVTVYGLGRGSARPTFNLTATGADVDIDAAGITFHNLLFTGGIDAIVAALDVNAPDFSLLNCEWRDVTGQVTDFLIADANADRLLIDGLVYHGLLAAASSASGTASGIVLVGCDRPIIRNSIMVGAFGVAAIECRTTAVVYLQSYNMRIANLDNQAVGTAGVAYEDVITGSTGVIGPNIFIDFGTDGANVTEAITGATFRVVDPVYVNNAGNQKALLINWTAVADS